MMLFFMFWLELFVHLTSARDFILLESLNQVPAGWKFARTASPTETISLRISLRQQNVDTFYDHLLQVSTPDHPRYGQHYEGHELRSMLQPRQETTNLAISWLQDHNVTSVEDDGDYILFRTDVDTANGLLDSHFAWYRNEDENQEILRTLAYSVPKDLKDHINFLQPTTRFGSQRSSRSSIKRVETRSQPSAPHWGSTSPKADISCNSSITPECIFNLYNVHYKADRKNGNTAAIASFLEIYTIYEDLTEFERIYAPYAKGENARCPFSLTSWFNFGFFCSQSSYFSFTVVEFHGGLNNQSSTGETDEGNLDMQYSLAIGYPTPITEYSTGGRGLLIPDGDSPTQADNFNEPYLDFLIALLKLPNSEIPNSISISYNENEQEIPVSYATQVCNMFAQLGARGKTVIFCSGDFGPGEYCLSNDGTNSLKFQPQFPASCPWVTSVGGTTQVEPEIAGYFSSGGFSNIWPRPAYQEHAVSSYLEKIGDHNKGYYNPNGRGTPDIAAQGLNVHIIDKGVDVPTHGTSCGAPIFNGIVALLNSARVSSGLPPLGFLNPWLYSVGRSALNDITEGASIGCNGFSKFMGPPNGSPVIPGASWNATEGWDAATGYGTPDFGKLLKLSTPWVENTGGVVPA